MNYLRTHKLKSGNIFSFFPQTCSNPLTNLPALKNDIKNFKD